MSVGIFGGAFNPPHIGHLICASEAVSKLGLDRVVFVPTGTAPHKQIASDPGAEMRLALTEAAVSGDERFTVSDVEVNRDGPSFTCDTLAELAGTLDQQEMVLVVGADQAAALPEWHRPDRVLELARLAVANRPGAGEREVEAAIDALGVAGRVTHFGIPAVDVSSSMVRERISGGLPVRYLVPEGVERLVSEKGLYR